MKRSGPLHRSSKPLARKAMERKPMKRWQPEVEGAAFWAAMREARLLIDSGECVSCGRPATDVHHETHLGMGASRYDPTDERNRVTNLVSLCRGCHEAEHRRTA